MSFWRELTRGFRTLVDRRSADADLNDELQNYIAQAAAAHIARGLGPAAARRAAQIEVGTPTSVHDQVRESTWENALATFASDIRYGARQLLRNPGFAFVAILTLALGIGATTAIFSAVDPILFQPLPYPHAERIAMIWEARSDGSAENPAYGTFFGLAGGLAGSQPQNRTHALAYAAVAKPWQPSMAGDGEPERFEGQRVTPDYFRVLGVLPTLGRNFAPSDDIRNAAGVIVISDRLWKRRFSSDPAIIGRHVTLDGSLFTVIGVMPAKFENVLAPLADVWTTLQYDRSLPADGREWGHHLQMIGLLTPGSGFRSAANELSTDLQPLTQTYAKGYASSGGPPRGILVHRLQDDLTQGVRPALLAILGAVLLVLLIACINVTNLVLARGAQRRSEFAMRAALGAGRSRLIRQLLAEGILLAFMGGTLAMALAHFAVRAIVALSPTGLPRISAVHIDLTVLAFAFAVTATVGILVGLLPALHASGHDPQLALQESLRTASRSHHATRRILVVAELAVSLVLLISAGLLLRSIRNVFSVDPGFVSSRVLTMQVQDSGRHTTDAALAHFYDAALQAVRAVPGVESAAITSQLPLSGDTDAYGVEFASLSKGPSDAAFRYCVSPEYFRTMHIPLRRGRYIDERDLPGGPVAVVISESFANRIFPNTDPIGQRVRLGPDAGLADKPWSVIVGVVGDVKQASLAVTNDDAFYIANAQWQWFDPAQSLVVRTHADPASLTSAVKQAIWSVDKDQPIVRVSTMAAIVAGSEAQRRFAFVLFEFFGLVSVLMAAVGIYGILSGGVTERTREIGVRAAFGASPRNILRLIMGQGMALAAIGVAIGVAGALAASRLLVTLLFGVTPLDPYTYACVTLLLLAVAAIACYLPARRAMRLNPISALRHE
ncbi:MAG: ABC transporter permease [Candidatus Acidiferrales bacterium]